MFNPHHWISALLGIALAIFVAAWLLHSAAELIQGAWPVIASTLAACLIGLSIAALWWRWWRGRRW
jgi:uncharacterized membrane protein